ncbi:MAG: M24 family metallopeptidase [Thermodesulfobacteriota bacterium]
MSDVPAIDHERLRRERFARCLEQMERHALDALVLGREANARYVSGAARLWLAGPRPFGPGCVVVRATREVHLLSTSEAGIPPEVPRSNLYALTWSPDALAARLARIPGLRAARRIGVDGWNHAAARLLATAAPDATIVDGGPALWAARRRKTADEVAAIRAALAIARGALDAAVAELRPGADEARLRGVLAQHAAAAGAPIPAVEATFRVASPAARSRSPESAHGGERRPLSAGDVVAIRAGVLLDGYEGTVARTVLCPGGSPPAGFAAVERRAERLRSRLLAACRPGAGSADLVDAYAACGEPLPASVIARGVGLGSEPPVIGAAHACEGFAMAPGTVLAVCTRVADEAAGALVREDVVHVLASGCELLA